MEDGQPVPGSIYVYAPNKGAPIFFTVAFAASATGHIWQCFRHKTWSLIGLHPFCAVLFTVGYALREYLSFNYIETDQTLIIYIMSQVFIFICPPLLELSNYHVLGRIFYYVPYLAPLPANRVLATFGALMAIVEALNAVGVALTANVKSANQGMGSNLTIASLGIQFAVILSFLVLAAIFHRRCVKAKVEAKPIPTLLIVMYASMALILIRCIYRLVEHLGDTAVHISDFESLKNLTPVLRYEWYFYVFEATLMLTNSIIWNIWNPGRYLPRSHDVYLAEDGRTLIEGEAKTGDFSFLNLLLSVLTLGATSAFKKKTTENPPFHELNEYSPPSR